ncbi:MAG: C-terminal binding protein [Pseudomonadales bacterium]
MQPELQALNNKAEPWFAAGIKSVTSEQWRDCSAIIGYGHYPEEVVRSLEQCQILVVPAVGYNTVDLDLWSSLGIPVCNTPDYGTREVADHAMALLLCLSKSIAFHDQSLREDPTQNWRPALNPFGQRLSTQTLGIVGLGRIGMATALRAKAFGMDISFYDPYVANGTDQALGITRARSLKALASSCDILSLHVPLTDETHGLINREVLSAAKPGLILINTARGAVVDFDALYESMRSDVVLAAGLDVLPVEPPDTNNPLISAWQNNEAWLKHRLVITPHSAFFTPQSMNDMRALPVATAVRYLTEGILENCINENQLTLKRAL